MSFRSNSFICSHLIGKRGDILHISYFFEAAPTQCQFLKAIGTIAPNQRLVKTLQPATPTETSSSAGTEIENRLFGQKYLSYLGRFPAVAGFAQDLNVSFSIAPPLGYGNNVVKLQVFSAFTLRTFSPIPLPDKDAH